MNCPNCGFEAQPGETVCLACGQPLYGVKSSSENTSFAVANENQTYDVVLKTIGGNKIAVIKVVKETFDLGLVEAKDTVEAMGVIATDMPRAAAEAFVAELRANGATAEICEAGECDEGFYEESEEQPANTNEYTPGNKPAMIGFILSLIALFMAILPMGMVQYSFWSLFAPPAIVLGAIGLKIAAKGGGKKIFAILALVFAIGAFLFMLVGATLRA